MPFLSKLSVWKIARRPHSFDRRPEKPPSDRPFVRLIHARTRFFPNCSKNLKHAIFLEFSLCPYCLPRNGKKWKSCIKLSFHRKNLYQIGALVDLSVPEPRSFRTVEKIPKIQFSWNFFWAPSAYLGMWKNENRCVENLSATGKTSIRSTHSFASEPRSSNAIRKIRNIQFSWNFF